MKKLLFFILVCGVMSGCTNDEYHDLPKDKIPLINNGTVCFKDSLSTKIDTFSLILTDYPKIDTESNINYHYQQIYISYYRPSMKSYFLKYYITTRTSDVRGYDFFIKYYYEGLYPNGTYQPISYTILGKTYSSVYLAYSNTYNNTPDTIPNKVYFTCQNGVIRYEYKEGRVYNLVSK